MTDELSRGRCRLGFLGMSRPVTLADSCLGDGQRNAGFVDGAIEALKAPGRISFVKGGPGTQPRLLLASLRASPNLRVSAISLTAAAEERNSRLVRADVTLAVQNLPECSSLIHSHVVFRCVRKFAPGQTVLQEWLAAAVRTMVERTASDAQRVEFTKFS